MDRETDERIYTFEGKIIKAVGTDFDFYLDKYESFSCKKRILMNIITCYWAIQLILFNLRRQRKLKINVLNHFIL